MKRRLRNHRRWGAVGVVVAALLSLPAQALAHGPSGTGGGEEFTRTFIIVLAIAAPIFLLVQGLLIFAVVRYRRKSDDEMPRQVTGNRRLELTWTLGSFAIILVLFGITVAVLSRDSGVPDNAMHIEITGHQWYWKFHYPETGVSVDSQTGASLMIPAERAVALDITSDDVQHSFWVPEWGGKVDAIPGRVNTIWFDFHETRSFVARCAEYCGKSHYEMLANVEVVDGEVFDAWMAEQIARMAAHEMVGTELDTPLPEGDAVAGEQVFLSQGCQSCHGQQDSSSGPALAGVGQRVATRRAGYTPELYLHEAIVQPCAYLVNGYPCIMRKDYGENLTPQQLADLIAYLLKQ